MVSREWLRRDLICPAMPDNRLFDAINLFKFSATGRGERHMTGPEEHQRRYRDLARTVETDAERSYVTFSLDPAAKFSDGKPVTAADVIFSWELLRDKGRPNYRFYYAKVAKAERMTSWIPTVLVIRLLISGKIGLCELAWYST